MAVYFFAVSNSLPLDWQPYGAYAINRDSFRGTVRMSRISWSALLFWLLSIFGIRCNSFKLWVNKDQVKNMHQFEKVKTAKKKWKYINEGRSESATRMNINEAITIVCRGKRKERFCKNSETWKQWQGCWQRLRWIQYRRIVRPDHRDPFKYYPRKVVPPPFLLFLLFAQPCAL